MSMQSGRFSRRLPRYSKQLRENKNITEELLDEIEKYLKSSRLRTIRQSERLALTKLHHLWLKRKREINPNFMSEVKGDSTTEFSVEDKNYLKSINITIED